jgi:hypothetical protein
MVAGREILYHDEDITVYPAIGKERLCGEGKHLIVVLNRHVERIYDLVSWLVPKMDIAYVVCYQGVSDVSILSNIVDTATRLLPDATESEKGNEVRIGFVGTIAR